MASDSVQKGIKQKSKNQTINKQTNMAKSDRQPSALGYRWIDRFSIPRIAVTKQQLKQILKRSKRTGLESPTGVSTWDGTLIKALSRMRWG